MTATQARNICDYIAKGKDLKESLMDRIGSIVSELETMDLSSKVEALNKIRAELHRVSPFASEPVDCVRWVESRYVLSNKYNPNKVAPPEFLLLEHSIREDGYTQPIVAWVKKDDENGIDYEVIDGFHRHRVGKESPIVNARIHGYLPLAVINDDRLDKGDRIASTIRHNRARGKHQVEAMSDIVIELKRRNWSDEKIGRELGMDPDEVLRLTQITGLAEMFSDQEFSQSWDIDTDSADVSLDDLEGSAPPSKATNRIYHTHELWECYPAGFYETKPPRGMTADQANEAYRDFLQNLNSFEAGLQRVISEWKHSCEHYLSNESMNRIAWLGQAAMCIATGVPSGYRGGFNQLSEGEQLAANQMALKWLNIWLVNRGQPQVDMEGAGVSAKVNMY